MLIDAQSKSKPGKIWDALDAAKTNLQGIGKQKAMTQTNCGR